MKMPTLEELADSLPQVLAAPADAGTLRMIVRRPGEEEREILEQGHLNSVSGLDGDNWRTRGSARTPDGLAHPDKQLNIMSSRVIDVLSTDLHHAALAGDQLYVDMNITEENMPAGTQLRIGSAVIEVTDEPHRGCVKFARRFGTDARRWVNQGDRLGLRLRGLNAKVVRDGTVEVGADLIKI